MKKIDLHIHTKPAPNQDRVFEFDISKFKKYTQESSIDAVAITNHNLFDLEQFKEIDLALEKVVVFPGIEINFEDGHLLLISENGNLADFNKKCLEIEKEYKEIGKITTQKLKDIFENLDNYLLIPHYDKRPIVNETFIGNLKDNISSGEVNSPKKFHRNIKNANSLIPVLFSDSRISVDLDIEKNQGKQTFIKTNANPINLDAVKMCLKDKNKVFLTPSAKHNFFQIFSNGQELSHGLNIVLGGRSSGKTHFLDNLKKTFGTEEKSVKYIKQFELVRLDEDGFNKLVEKERSEIREKYLKEFKVVVEDILKISRPKTQHRIDKYIDSLLQYATSEKLQDEFSRAVLFKETPFPLRKDDSLKNLIQAVYIILYNKTHQATIQKYLTSEKLKELLLDFTNQFKEKEEIRLKKEWVNELITNIGDQLKQKSSSPSIEYNDLDFYEIKIEREKIKRFNKIANSLKTEREINSKQSFGKFTIQALAGPFGGAGELKEESRRKDVQFSKAFNKYESPIEFLEIITDFGILEKTELYRYFCKVRYQVLNQYGKSVSGGERAEFNLLKALQDARQFEMLLIDEPESSFDNLFLKDNVNQVLKEISSELPVVVVTHNNTVGMLMQPDFILYTKREINAYKKDEYYIYSGSPGDKEFKTEDGAKTVDSHETLMDALEAGEEAYGLRGNLYKNFKK